MIGKLFRRPWIAPNRIYVVVGEYAGNSLIFSPESPTQFFWHTTAPGLYEFT